MRTATIQRSLLALKSSIRFEAPVSSERTTVALRPGDLADQLGVGARRVLVGGDDEAARVRDGLPDLGQPLVGGLEHARHPLAARVEGGAPGLQIASLVIGSPSRAAISSPAFVRQRMLPL